MHPRQTISQAQIPKTVQALLESEFNLPGLVPGKIYGRVHALEECGGLAELCVLVLENRDVCVYITNEQGESTPLRFCSYEGGGSALRTRNALILLAEAIRLDNLDHSTG